MVLGRVLAGYLIRVYRSATAVSPDGRDATLLGEINTVYAPGIHRSSLGSFVRRL